MREEEYKLSFLKLTSNQAHFFLNWSKVQVQVAALCDLLVYFEPLNDDAGCDSCTSVTFL